MQGRGPSPSFNLFQRDAHIVEGASVDVIKHPIGTCRPYEVRDGFGQEVEAFFALPQRLFGPLTFSDVTRYVD